MLKIPGRYIGDAWYYVHEDTAHCYFLTQLESTPIEERTHHWDMGHAVSSNLVDWEFVGLARSRGIPGEWDSQKLSTGSVIGRDGRFWFAYNASKTGEGPTIQRIGMAVSDDLYNWIKYENNPVTELDPAIYEPTGHWHDPFTLDMGERVYHYVWCGMPGGWCFSLLRWQCPGRYSGKCWSVSVGSIQHQGSEYPWGHLR